jgi:acyl carrier protein
MTETAAKVLDFIQENVPSFQFNAESDGDTPLNKLGVDSLDKMSILLNVQEHWNKEFTPDQINELKTFNDMVRSVES